MQKCTATPEIYARVCGYHRPVKYWNKGKKEEFKDRLLYKFNTDKKPEIKNETKNINICDDCGNPIRSANEYLCLDCRQKYKTANA